MRKGDRIERDYLGRSPLLMEDCVRKEIQVSREELRKARNEGEKQIAGEEIHRQGNLVCSHVDWNRRQERGTGGNLFGEKNSL